MYIHTKATSKEKKKNKTTTSTTLTVSRLHLDGASHLKEEKQYRQDKGLVQAQETAVTTISLQPVELMSNTKQSCLNLIKCKYPHVSLQGTHCPLNIQNKRVVICTSMPSVDSHPVSIFGELRSSRRFILSI